MPMGWPRFDGEQSQFAFQGSHPEQTYFVRVCSFTFRFTNLKQLQLCRAYYQQKVRPSSRLPYSAIREFIETGQRGREVQRWFDRLPMHLLENGKRERVCSALERAHREWSKRGTL